MWVVWNAQSLTKRALLWCQRPQRLPLSDLTPLSGQIGLLFEIQCLAHSKHRPYEVFKIDTYLKGWVMLSHGHCPIPTQPLSISQITYENPTSLPNHPLPPINPCWSRGKVLQDSCSSRHSCMKGTWPCEENHNDKVNTSRCILLSYFSPKVTCFTLDTVRHPFKTRRKLQMTHKVTKCRVLKGSESIKPTILFALHISQIKTEKGCN